MIFETMRTTPTTLVYVAGDHFKKGKEMTFKMVRGEIRFVREKHFDEAQAIRFARECAKADLERPEIL